MDKIDKKALPEAVKEFSKMLAFSTVLTFACVIGLASYAGCQNNENTKESKGNAPETVKKVTHHPKKHVKTPEKSVERTN